MRSNKNIKRKLENTHPSAADSIQSMSVEETSIYVGPLPHPDVLKGYENSCSGAADRIIKMAEEENSARHQFNMVALKATIEDTKRAMYFAGILAIFIIIGSVILLMTDHYIVGTIFSIPGLGLTYKAFLSRSINDNNESFKD